jgi:hypothetical protein
MWSMAGNALTLFLRGQLFANPRKAYGRLAAGVMLTAIICLLLAAVGAPLWTAAITAGFLGGGLQTFLFKTVKFR